MVKKRLTIQKAILVLITLMVLIIPLTANADDGDVVPWDGGMWWSPDILLSDNTGGAIVVEPRPGIPFGHPAHISAQRYDHNGKELWGPNGVEVSHLLNPTYPDAYYPAATEDMFGNIIVAYASINNIYAQRLDANGNKLWDEEIVVLYDVNPVHSPIITPDGAGGAYIGYGRKINHISNDGTVIDSNGYEYVPSVGVREFSMVYDGQRTIDRRTGEWLPGGVFLAWYSTSTEKIHAQHFKNGLLWGDTTAKEGVIVSTAYTYLGVPSERPTLRLMRDGIVGLDGGLIVAWSGRWVDISQVRAQRLNAGGDPEWGDDGVAVVDSSVVGGVSTIWHHYLKPPELTTDGAGGAILTWEDMRDTTPDNLGDRDVYCQRVNADGSFHWKTNGILVTWKPIDFANAGTERSPAMVSDGNGGVVIAVQYFGSSQNIFINRIDGEGVTIWTEWFGIWDDGDEFKDQTSPRIVFDGTGPEPKGAIVGWLGSQIHSEGYARKIEISDSPPGNDNIADAYTIYTYTGSASHTIGSVYRATNDGSSWCGTTGQPDVWYKFTAPDDGVLDINTCGTHDLYDFDVGLDTVLSLHSGIPGTIDNELVCSDNSFRAGCAVSGFNTDSFLTRSLNSGETVYIRVARYDSTTNGQFYLDWSFEPMIDTCEGNFDSDTDVDGTDLAIFAADFGRTDCINPPPCVGDFDDDGDVDGSDLALFAADFGRTDCP
jgi:hypothetical protein